MNFGKRSLLLLATSLFTTSVFAASAIVSWNWPTQNTDGSTIPASGNGALESATVLYGLCNNGNVPANADSVESPYPTSSVEILGLGYGDWCFGAKAQNNLGAISDLSNVAVKSIVEPNSAPTLTHPGKQTNYVGQSVNLQLEASDPDNDPLVFTATNLPSGLTMNTLGTITGTVDTVQNTYVSVTVEDPEGASDSLGFGWDVLQIPTPQPPTIVTVDTVVYEFKENGRISKYVGRVALGVECGQFMKSNKWGDNWHDISIDKVQLTRMPTTAVIVAKCKAT